MLRTRGHDFLQILATSLLLGSGGCSDADTAAPAGGELDELVGDFTVRLTAQNSATGAAARSSVVGLVKDGPDPEPIVWHATDQSGDCTLFEPEAPFCDPACGGRAVCTGDDECAPYPDARSVGTVQLRGLGRGQLQLTPISGNYMPDKGVLPYPPCDEGAPVELHADGGDYPEFSLETRCIAPLSFDATLRLERGKDLAFTWGSPGRPDLARVQVKLDISHHGGAKGKVECDASDTGELAIAGSLVDRLLDLGVAGFPTIALTRRARSGDSREPHNVHLSVLQTVERAVEVPGVMSCTADPQCPAAQKCATNLTCQPR
ncbi:MAG TPA: hypothetical protein VJV78_07210 [Polyangiales bacterium]|nr:hypothetical protein [Polyangiales bacterium]